MEQPFDIPQIFTHARREWDYFFVETDGADSAEEKIVVEAIRGSDRPRGRVNQLSALRELGAEPEQVELGEKLLSDGDAEGMANLLNTVGGEVADDLNEQMPEELKKDGFSFEFEWHDGLLCLVFGKDSGGDVIDAEVVSETPDGETEDEQAQD